MALDKKTVKQIGTLARLQLADDDLPAYQAELDQILTLVDQLNAATTADVVPLAHPLDLKARLRPDTVTENDQREVFQGLAPAVQDGLYLVPKVID